MTQNFMDMLEFFGAGALGFDSCKKENIDITAIRRLAIKQGIWHTVYISLSKVCDISDEGMNVLLHVGKNIRKNEYLLNISDELKKHGIDICFLKGIAVSGLYKEPDFRVSGDIDILIQKNQVRDVVGFLKNKNFEVENLMGQMHHFDAKSEASGLIEVHVALVKKKINDVLFKGMIGVAEPYSEAEYHGRTILTLGVNDNINFLTAHFIKHFLLGGVGLKHVMDMLIFMCAHEKDIDWQGYNRLWTELGYINLINKVKAIGNKYWHMNLSDADETDLDLLLDDIESSGAFGNAEVSNDFLDIFISRKYGKDKAVMKSLNRMERASILNKLFPEKKYMAKKGYIRDDETGIAVAVAYVKRLIDLFLELFKRKRKLSELTGYNLVDATDDMTEKRLEVLKKIGIL